MSISLRTVSHGGSGNNPKRPPKDNDGNNNERTGCFSCGNCGKIYKRLNALVYHMSNGECMNVTWYRCRMISCNRGYRTLEGFRRHIFSYHPKCGFIEGLPRIYNREKWNSNILFRGAPREVLVNEDGSDDEEDLTNVQPVILASDYQPPTEDEDDNNDLEPMQLDFETDEDGDDQEEEEEEKENS